MMDSASWASEWRAEVVRQTHFHLDDLTLSQSEFWSYSRGALRHRSGRFFNIVGISWHHPLTNALVVRPLIEQREVGTLGFLLRRRDGANEVLLQAKTEPGNVGIVQYAPTCQATASNAARVHGGATPPFISAFMDGEGKYLSDTLQSEHGTRFLGKRNRNVLKMSEGEIPESLTHRWVAVDDVLALLTEDFLINTDARSVLICSPLEKLAGRTPFTRYETAFCKDLSRSGQAGACMMTLETVKHRIEALRKKTRAPEILDLDRLPGWHFDVQAATPLDGADLVVRHVRVFAQDREVPTWDQPLVQSKGIGQIDLICGRHNGILHFLFHIEAEPGLPNLVELAPTILKTAAVESNSQVRAECLQSEEGGRFFQDVNRYRIVDVGDLSGYQNNQAADCWLTLVQIQKLLAEGAWFTNEARSALSLLLVWL